MWCLGGAYNIQGSFSNTIMVRHDKVEYKCEVCQEVKVGAKNLRNHRRIHQNSECDYCHKSFIKSNKNRHQLTCREKRVNYKCEMCKYACGVKSDLNKKHIKH